MKSDYERIRGGIELMTAYTSGNDLAQSYIAGRRREDQLAIEDMFDGATALCALLLAKLARDNGITQHEVLQEVARAAHRREQGPEE
jgi:hypothetical protein